MPSPPGHKAIFHIVGMPLDETETISEMAREILHGANVVIGESRAVTMKYLKRAGGTGDKAIFFLDNQRDLDRADLDARLILAHENAERVALLSDVGMPILFDPGQWVLERARRLGFVIHSVPAATSWGTACALSGYEPPFLVFGFLPRDKQARLTTLKKLASSDASIVFMETPYRFKLFLEQFKQTFGNRRESFLAWEIGKPGERLLWGNIHDLEIEVRKHGMEKGEFVWITAPLKRK